MTSLTPPSTPSPWRAVDRPRASQRRDAWMLLGLLLAAPLVGACDDDDSDEPSKKEDICTEAKDVVAVQQGTAVTGGSGHFKAVVDDANPAPPLMGDNAWVLAITNANGAPLSDAAKVTVSTYMPDHRHGGPSVPKVGAGANGMFDVEDLTLHMAGTWEVTVSVEDQGVKDDLVFRFCIDDL